MEKEFKTINEQIEILKSRNIIVKDYNKAYKILEKNNYYYLINGYKDLFLNEKHKDEYISNTKIEEVYAIYQFDKNMKMIFLKYILLIENEINTYIAYEFSKTYGHKDYLILKNFNNKLATRDLFSIAIILKLLLEKEDFNNFYTKIIKNIDLLEKEIATISINKVLYRMGFPNNYKDLLHL